MQLLIGHGQVPTIMPEASNIIRFFYNDKVEQRFPKAAIFVARR